MAELLTNRAGTFVAAPGLTVTATTLNVTSTIGFPSSGNFRIRIESELLLVQTVNNTSWTVLRGIEGTTATPHLQGTKLTAVLTAGGLAQYVAEQIAASK